MTWACNNMRSSTFIHSKLCLIRSSFTAWWKKTTTSERWPLRPSLRGTSSNASSLVDVTCYPALWFIKWSCTKNHVATWMTSAWTAWGQLNLYKSGGMRSQVRFRLYLHSSCLTTDLVRILISMLNSLSQRTSIWSILRIVADPCAIRSAKSATSSCQTCCPSWGQRLTIDATWSPRLTATNSMKKQMNRTTWPSLPSLDTYSAGPSTA